MSKTFKTQRAYHAHKKEFGDLSTDTYHEHNETFRDVGQRYGNQRKMRAKLKVSERRIRRRQENRQVPDTE